MALKIVSNKQARPIIYWHDLTEKEKAEFDYLEKDTCAQESASFFRYKGAAYCLDGFMRANAPEFKAWDGYANDTYFSGVLIKLTNEGDSVIVGRFYS